MPKNPKGQPVRLEPGGNISAEKMNETLEQLNLFAGVTARKGSKVRVTPAGVSVIPPRQRNRLEDDITPVVIQLAQMVQHDATGTAFEGVIVPDYNTVVIDPETELLVFETFRFPPSDLLDTCLPFIEFTNPGSVILPVTQIANEWFVLFPFIGTCDP